MYYLDPRGVNKTDEVAYQQAMANCDRKLAELESQENPTMVSTKAIMSEPRRSV